MRLIGFTLLSLLLLGATASVKTAVACSRNDVCEGIKYCAIVNLTDKNRVDRDRLTSAINQGDGNGIYSATEACQHNVGDIKAWKNDSRGCTSADYALIARDLTAASWTCGKRVRWDCVDKGNGGHLLGELNEECTGAFQSGAICSCPLGAGQVQPFVH